MAENPDTPDPLEAINLKDPLLAAFLAWLIPGLGHAYQGRWAKAGLFFVCILGTFVYGCYLGGSSDLGWGRVVYASWRDDDRRLPYLCQIGAGLPALPALVQAQRVRGGKDPWWNGFMAPPRRDQVQPLPGQLAQPTLHDLNRRLNRYFELGTIYTMIAGLLNILAIYDAGAGPVILVKKEDEEEPAAKDEKPDDATPPTPTP